jgi:hypothetical protein
MGTTTLILGFVTIAVLLVLVIKLCRGPCYILCDSCDNPMPDGFYATNKEGDKYYCKHCAERLELPGFWTRGENSAGEPNGQELPKTPEP